ncbi:hypothetical protein HY732_04130 [Candidatus Uhrbacteria bacterium]|nr:hypothetical protein [Candidatus Uhrbacteria bacterium]
MQNQSSLSSVASLVDVDLYTQLYLDRMSEEERIQFLESFFFVIYMRVVQRILDSLSDEDQNTLEGLMKSRTKDVDTVRIFLETHIPQFEQMERDEVAKYRKELIEDMDVRMQVASM